MSIGENNKRARKKETISKRRSYFAFFTPQAISRYENNKVEPNIEVLRKLCLIFEVSSDDLLDVPHYGRRKV